MVVRELYDVAGGLARSYLFEGLTAEELVPLAEVVTTRQLVRGETLCRVGDTADEIYVVLSWRGEGLRRGRRGRRGRAFPARPGHDYR